MKKLMRKKSTLLILFGPIIVLTLISLTWVYLAHPFLANWIKSQIPEINQKQNYAQVQIQDIDLSLLKLRLIARGIEIDFSKGVDPYKKLSKITAESARVQIDPFHLIIGQVSISHLILTGVTTEQNWADIEKIIPQEKNKPKEIDLKPLFDVLDEVPLRRLSLVNTKILLQLSNHDHPSLRAVEAFSPSTIVTLKKRSLDLQLRNIELKATNALKVSSLVQVNAEGQINEKSYNLGLLQIRNGQSEISLQSRSKSLSTLMTNPQTNTTFSAQLKLDELKNLVYLFKDQTKRLPQISGTIRAEGAIETNGLKNNRGEFEIKTSEVRYENLKFGDAQASSKLNNSQLQIQKISILHPSGKAELSNISITQTKPFPFRAQVDVSEFNLQKLFTSLNLKNIPADMNAQAKGNCEGTLDEFILKCVSEIAASDIDVKPDVKDSFHIVQINKITALGDIVLTKDHFSYQAQLKIPSEHNPESLIHSQGEVGFDTGFNMHFQSDRLQLDSIKNIAHLDLKGAISGELNTHGDTDFGVIQSKIKAESFIIDRFSLGNLETNLRYEKGSLYFNQTTGELGKSKYAGQVSLNLNRNTIEGSILANPLNGADIIPALEKRWNLPIRLTGEGETKINLSGPLDFWQMHYTLNGFLKRASVQDEYFNRIDFNLNSDGNRVHFNPVVFYKPTGVLKVTDYIQAGKTKPEFHLAIHSQDLKMEEVDHLSDLLQNISGNLIAQGTITGPVESPIVKVQTSLKDFSIDSQKIPNSQGDFEISLDKMSFIGQIFGRQAQTELQIPFNEKNNYLLKSQLRDFNPLVLLPFINLPIPTNDTQASLNGDIDLKTQGSKWSTLSGSITAQNVLLQRSSQYLKLMKPSAVQFDHGLKSMTPFEMTGPDQTVKIYLQNKNKLAIASRIFLRPLQFLVPFADNLSGIAEFNCFVALDSSTLNLSGEGLIDSASISMKGFKYPLNDISAFFDFSQSKINISEVSATLNQTPITGQGYVDIRAPKNIQVNIEAETEKLDLEFPNQYQTAGYAQIQMYGNWLPYTLKINYQIDEGNITKEFTEEEEVAFTLRPSPYLPPKQLSLQNQSLLLDVQANFSKGIAVKNSILEGIVTGYMNVKGTPENPLLLGRVDIQQGSRLIFKDKPFDVQNGVISFNGDHVINPTIYINSNARISDYDINLIVQGKAKSLDIRPTSQPYLSREDIISLLAIGYTASKNDQTISSDVQQQQTGLEVLAALSNQSSINKKLEQKLGLNVQLAPTIDSTRNIAVPKVIVSKKLNKKITTSISRPLTGDSQESEVRLQYLWTRNWSVILNYQNQTNQQQNSILQNTQTDTGIGGIDLEFKKEFD